MLELFSGSKVMSETFKEHGWDTFTIDYNPKYKPDLVADINMIEPEHLIEQLGDIDSIWSSPDCTCLSIAGIQWHWKHFIPDDKAVKAIELDKHTVDLILKLNPKYWFIENPRGMLRKQPFMLPFPRYTVTYCQYGDTRQKPTDIFTNHPNPRFKPACKPGAPCHISTPRSTHPKGSTEGISDPFFKSMIPKALCEHVVKICED
jgi:site-specific DNA-cytosine methylase